MITLFSHRSLEKRKLLAGRLWSINQCKTQTVFLKPYKNSINNPTEENWIKMSKRLKKISAWSKTAARIGCVHSKTILQFDWRQWFISSQKNLCTSKVHAYYMTSFSFFVLRIFRRLYSVLIIYRFRFQIRAAMLTELCKVQPTILPECFHHKAIKFGMILYCGRRYLFTRSQMAPITF